MKIVRNSRLAKALMLGLPAVLASAMLAAPAQAATEITFQTWNSQDSQDKWNAMTAAFMKANPDIIVKTNFVPGGVEGDALVKSQLASGTMTDVFAYNVGALMQAIDPVRNLVNLKNEPWMKSVNTGFIPSATGADGGVYAAPFGTAMGGGILYNKRIYSKLGLQIPLTWKEFMANNAKIKKAGITPVISSWKDSWTAQLFVLGDHFNVAAAMPGFEDKFTKNKIVLAKNPATLAGFQHLEEVRKAGYYNKDVAATTFAKALEYLALGKGAHYPMLSAGIDTIVANFPTKASDIGFMAQPGTNAKSNGVTVWMPSGVYISKTSKNLEAAKKFVAWTVSKESFEVQNKVVPPSGPYFIKGAPVSGNLTAVFTDLYNYMQGKGTSYPALEFLTPVKGPNLSQICVEIGSGQKNALQGAQSYQKDLQKQSQQLGLAGW
ncbi:MAG: ABC transporter substrate-binding protein [Candidatus Planktophila sp.]|nr:ABC transporter substrate-binding protein [Candidatus Planktophila sp.]